MNEWEEIKRQAKGSHAELSGILRVVRAPQLGKTFLAKGLADFITKYPNIELQYEYSSQEISLLDTQTDLYIGFEPLVKDKTEIIGKLLGTFKREYFASPTYLAAHGTPKKPEELIHHHCITWSKQNTWKIDGKDYKIKSNFFTNSPDTMIALALEHAGIVSVPKSTVINELKDKKLVPVFGGRSSLSCSAYAYYPKLPYTPLKTQKFIESFQQSFEKLK